MDVDLERIRLRAYEIWEGEGRRGDPMEHWLRAEREMRPGLGAGTTLEASQPADAAAALEAVTAAQPALQKRTAAKASAKVLPKAPAAEASAAEASAATRPATKSSAKSSAGTAPEAALPAAATAAPRAAKATRPAARKES